MVLLGLVAVAGIGLMRLSSHVIRLSSEAGSGGGTIVRYELTHLWLPRTLTELARLRSSLESAGSHEEWRRWLESRDRRGVWYALTAKASLANGDFVDLTTIRWPYDDASHLDEFEGILATVAGRPPSGPGPDYSKASVHVLDEEASRREPREVMADLLRPRASSGGAAAGRETDPNGPR